MSKIALGAIVEDHAQARVGSTLRVGERLAHLGDIGFLAAEDEPRPGLISALQLERTGLPNATVEFLLHLLEQRLEVVEVLAFLAIGDLLGRPLLGG